jgi:hypothetical protein
MTPKHLWMGAEPTLITPYVSNMPQVIDNVQHNTDVMKQCQKTFTESLNPCNLII